MVFKRKFVSRLLSSVLLLNVFSQTSKVNVSAVQLSKLASKGFFKYKFDFEKCKAWVEEFVKGAPRCLLNIKHCANELFGEGENYNQKFGGKFDNFFKSKFEPEEEDGYPANSYTFQSCCFFLMGLEEDGSNFEKIEDYYNEFDYILSEKTGDTFVGINGMIQRGWVQAAITMFVFCQRAGIDLPSELKNTKEEFDKYKDKGKISEIIKEIDSAKDAKEALESIKKIKIDDMDLALYLSKKIIPYIGLNELKEIKEQKDDNGKKAVVFLCVFYGEILKKSKNKIDEALLKVFLKK